MKTALPQLKTYTRNSENDRNAKGGIKLISALPNPEFRKFWSSFLKYATESSV